MTAPRNPERAAAFAVLAAMALAVTDAGIVNVALPSFARAFGANAADAVLVVGAYQAALLIGLLPCAHIAERIGYRTLFKAGIALFCGAALLSASASSLWLLIAARFIQGLGGAAIMALGIALLRVALGDDRLGSAIAWNALTVAICSAAGPAIGAVILSVASWQWLFLVTLPIGAAAFVAARTLPDDTATRHRIDPPAIGLYAATVLLLLLGTRMLATHTFEALLLAASGIACLLCLLRIQRTRVAPLLPVDLLGRRSFALQVGASVCCFIGQSIGLVSLPFYVQSVLGSEPLVTGLVITCWPVAVAVTSTVANRAKRPPPTAIQCVAGSGTLAAGLLLSATVTPHSDVIRLAAGASLCGVGFGLFQLANNRALFVSAPMARAAAAGGMQGTARLAGQTTGTLFASLIFAATAPALGPRAAMLVGAGFALLAVLISANTGHMPPLRRNSQAGTCPTNAQENVV